MATRTPKSASTETPKADANPMPTLTPEALASLLGQLTEQGEEIKRLQAALTAKPEPAKLSVAGKTTKQVSNEIAVVRAFKREGYGVVIPHENVRTFNRWVAAGRRPIEGSHSVRAGGLRLFHLSQTRPLQKGEAKDMAAKAEARKGAKVVPISTGAHPQ